MTEKFYEESDTDNARLLVETHKDEIRYVVDQEVWFIWQDGIWHQDTKGLTVANFWTEIAYGMPKRIEDPKKNDGSTIPFAWRKYSLSASGIRHAVELSKQHKEIQAHRENFDSNAYELNTPNGTVDLRLSKLQDPDPSHLHSKKTKVIPKNQKTPMWDKFLDDTFEGNQDIVRYVQDVMGIAAIGEVIQQFLPFAYGPGGTGKSTFFETIQELLGDYATTADTSLVVRGRDKHPEQLARLQGQRIVIMSELEQGDRFHEQRLKLLTGNDSITARNMRENSFSFTPTHSLFLFGNYKPTISETGDAIWRRLKLIPFVNQQPYNKYRVEQLKKELVSNEGPGILQWIIDGAQRYLANPKAFKIPEEIERLTREYQEEEDVIGQFVSEKCLVAENAEVATTRIWQVYESWCHANGHKYPLGRNKLARALADPSGKYGKISMGHRLDSRTRGLKGINVLINDNTDARTGIQIKE